MPGLVLYRINENRHSGEYCYHYNSSQIMALNEKTIEIIQKEYSAAQIPWLIGYSGGKDSSALVKLVYQALKGIKNPQKPVTIIYCDTGVEFPIVKEMVRSTLSAISIEAKNDSIPLDVKIAEPSLSNRFFVKVIGRGYPPPTNKFRWCTDRLRIQPVNDVLRALNVERSIVLLGIRRGESTERDKTITRHQTADTLYFKQANNSNVLLFCPILHYSLEDVWNTIQNGKIPKSIDGPKLLSLYKDASGECPIIRDPKGSPCGHGRFGCWTCTVVRKDRAMQSLVLEGYEHLRPLLDWRNWLIEIRDDHSYRCKRRRNGQVGLGPFTLEARKEIFNKLIIAQNKTPWTLIADEEIKEIKVLWQQDKRSPKYREI